MNFIFCKLEKPQKTGISVFASLKNLKKYEFHFFFFCKLEKPQKTWISFFASFLKTWISFLQAKNHQKTWIAFFASLKNLKKHEFHFMLSLATLQPCLFSWDMKPAFSMRMEILTRRRWRITHFPMHLTGGRPLPLDVPGLWSLLSRLTRLSSAIVRSLDGLSSSRFSCSGLLSLCHSASLLKVSQSFAFFAARFYSENSWTMSMSRIPRYLFVNCPSF